ncbi:MAG: CTP synthase [Holosporaceae bacterium]|jgi:CTP synthase|nr:CTP synthase [Holosporaceae bacterium]
MSYFIFVTGGVMSSLGKGIASATIGSLLQARGFSVRMKKMDPYINVDPGTLSPHKHGEVFVLSDGCESDLDFGHYERFTNVQCAAEDSLTMGKVYEKVLRNERKGTYLGSDIQVIPHITNEIKEFIQCGHGNTDFIICEVGGTIGDIEGLPYVEAIRQLTLELEKKSILCIHLTYLPYIKTSGELKTKPTQHSVKQLQSMGVQPDIILCRSEKSISNEIKVKLSTFCNVKKENIIAALDAENIYLIPNQYHSEGLDRQILRCLDIKDAGSDTTRGKGDDDFMGKWASLEHSILKPSKSIRIAVVGKYVRTKDAYISLAQAISHAGFANDAKIDVDWIDSREDQDQISRLETVSGIIVPGGFDVGGSEGKMQAIKFAREHNVPFLGICLGLQLAVIESCRNIAGVIDATSREFSEEGSFVIDFMDNWEKDGVQESRMQADNKGGTMRLGNYVCKILEGTLAHKIYGTTETTERHRHRFEVNIRMYRDVFAKAGLIFSGVSANGSLPEILERKDHSFFIATQAHPEFKSSPFAPHPLFVAFVEAAIRRLS